MRILKWYLPYKPNKTQLSKELIEHTGDINYWHCCSVFTKHGIVVIEDMIHDTNHGPFSCTFFRTIYKGHMYYASLDEGKLSEKQMKWMATHFIKKVIDKSWRNYI